MHSDGVNGVVRVDGAIDRINAIKDAYTPAVHCFTAWLDGRDVSPLVVEEYFRTLAASGLAANTIRIRRSAVKRRLRQLLDGADAADQDRMESFLKKLDRDVRPPTVQARSSRKIVTEAEYRAMRSRCSARTGLLIDFLLSTGCRAAELCGARVDRCREGEAGYIDVTVIGKRSKERVLTISAALHRAILAEYRGTVFLFENREGRQYKPTYVSRKIRGVATRTLKRRFGAHTMRHSYATAELARGLPIEAVSRQLGHSSVAITMSTYAHRELSAAEAVLPWVVA